VRKHRDLLRSRLRWRLGRKAYISSLTEAADTFGVSRFVAKYWKTKVADPLFHPGSHGGKRYSKFSDGVELFIHAHMWLLCKCRPFLRLAEYVEEFRRLGISVTKKYISRIFKSWRWSMKTASYKQINKYTWKNICLYGCFLYWVQSADLTRLKFLDEGHFVSRELVRQKARGPINEPVVATSSEALDESYSLTILCHFRQHASSLRLPVYAHIRKESNNQWDFFKFIVSAIWEGELNHGDFLIMDNASIHKAEDMIVQLDSLCSHFGITVLFLPAYSPELNPCELVFGWLKNYLRNNRHQEVPIWFEIVCLLGYHSPGYGQLFL